MERYSYVVLYDCLIGLERHCSRMLDRPVTSKMVSKVGVEA